MTYHPNVRYKSVYGYKFLGSSFGDLFAYSDVIHTVGPQGEKSEDLRNCYKNSFKLMLDNNLKIIVS